MSASTAIRIRLPQPVTPAAGVHIPPATVAEVVDDPPMRSPAAFAAPPCPSEPDHGRELRPVDGVEEAVLGPDRHGGAPCHSAQRKRSGICACSLSFSLSPRTAAVRRPGTWQRIGARRGARDGAERRRGDWRTWRGRIEENDLRSPLNLDQSGALEPVHSWSLTHVTARPHAGGCAQAHLTNAVLGVLASFWPSSPPSGGPIQRRSDLTGCCAVVG